MEFDIKIKKILVYGRMSFVVIVENKKENVNICTNIYLTSNLPPTLALLTKYADILEKMTPPVYGTLIGMREGTPIPERLTLLNNKAIIFTGERNKDIDIYDTIKVDINKFFTDDVILYEDRLYRIISMKGRHSVKLSLISGYGITVNTTKDQIKVVFPNNLIQNLKDYVSPAIKNYRKMHRTKRIQVNEQ